MAITMNLVSEFVLERLLPSGAQRAVFPSVLDPLGPVNMRHSSSHLRPVHVPGSDVMKAAKGAGSLQIISGDSNVVATLEPASYDGVVSVFYLDACGSLLAAIDAAWQALVAGGVWVSLGPLEYNGADGGHQGDGMRLCGDELLRLVGARGFEVMEVHEVPCAYTQDKRSMLQQHFDCLFFVARKLESPKEGHAAPPPAGNTQGGAPHADGRNRKQRGGGRTYSRGA